MAIKGVHVGIYFHHLFIHFPFQAYYVGFGPCLCPCLCLCQHQWPESDCDEKTYQTTMMNIFARHTATTANVVLVPRTRLLNGVQMPLVCVNRITPCCSVMLLRPLCGVKKRVQRLIRVH